MQRPAALLLSAFLLTTATPRWARADDVPPAEAARSQRNVGIIFTAFGIVAGAVAAVAGAGIRSCAHASGEECGIVAFSTTVGMGVGAFSLLAPGIPMWIAGDRRLRRAQRSVSLGVAPLVSAQGGGVEASATVRF